MTKENVSAQSTPLEVRVVNDHVAIYPVGGAERVASIYAPMDKPERLMPAKKWAELLARAPELAAENEALHRECLALAKGLRDLLAWVEACKCDQTSGAGVGIFRTEPVVYEPVAQARALLTTHPASEKGGGQ